MDRDSFVDSWLDEMEGEDPIAVMEAEPVTPPWWKRPAVLVLTLAFVAIGVMVGFKMVGQDQDAVQRPGTSTESVMTSGQDDPSQQVGPLGAGDRDPSQPGVSGLGMGSTLGGQGGDSQSDQSDPAALGTNGLAQAAGQKGEDQLGQGQDGQSLGGQDNAGQENTGQAQTAFDQTGHSQDGRDQRQTDRMADGSSQDSLAAFTGQGRRGADNPDDPHNQRDPDGAVASSPDHSQWMIHVSAELQLIDYLRRQQQSETGSMASLRDPLGIQVRAVQSLPLGTIGRLVQVRSWDHNGLGGTWVVPIGENGTALADPWLMQAGTPMAADIAPLPEGKIDDAEAIKVLTQAGWKDVTVNASGPHPTIPDVLVVAMTAIPPAGSSPVSSVIWLGGPGGHRHVMGM